MSLPCSIRGLAPLLCVARVLGLAPYSLHQGLPGQPPMLRRSNWALAMSGVVMTIEATLVIIASITVTSSNINIVKNESKVKYTTLMIVINIVACSQLLLFVCISVANSRVTLWGRLLKLLTVLDESSSKEEALKLPLFAQHRFVIGIMVAWSTTFFSYLTISHIFWRYSIYICILNFICLCDFCITAQIFCTLMLLVKNYFRIINKSILKISDRLRLQPNVWKENYGLFLEKESKVVLTQKYLNGETCTARKSDLKQDILRIRETHFLVYGMCTLINDIFKHLLLNFYVASFLMMIQGLFMMVRKLRESTSLLTQIFTVMGPISGGSLGAVVAWAAGNATSVGYDAALESATALHLAAHGRPEEHNAQQFLLQLRGRSPPHFTAGGLFPLNLRFFLSLCGTIIGYLVILLQFSDTP